MKIDDDDMTTTHVLFCLLLGVFLHVDIDLTE